MSSFFHLPVEILELIITSTLPDDFERLALVSKKLNSLSQPFFARHNARKSQFRHFEYNKQPRSPFDLEIRSAWDLIVSISADPNIAHYILHADLRGDTISPQDETHNPVSDVYSSSSAIELIRASPFLQVAGLDPEWFIAEIASNLSNKFRHPRYSQAAAVFVISLLPKVVSLTLPKYWDHHPSSWDDDLKLQQLEKILNAVVSKASKRKYSQDQTPLLQLSEITFSCDWHWPQRAAPFLALPRVNNLCARDAVHIRHDADDLDPLHAERLETLCLEQCYFLPQALSGTLEALPNLKVLKYSQSNKTVHHFVRWHVFAFLDLIGRTVGTHLEGLSLTAHYLTGILIFDNISMSNFKRLRKLEFGLELVVCIIDYRRNSATGNPGTAAPVSEDSLLCLQQPLFSVLVPHMVTELSIVARSIYPGVRESYTSQEHPRALAALFDNFSTNKDTVAPALKTIFLDCAADAADAYKIQCEQVRAQIGETDVVLHLRTPVSFLLETKDLRYEPPE